MGQRKLAHLHAHVVTAASAVQAKAKPSAQREKPYRLMSSLFCNRFT
jgi:hypothetical protein